MSVNIQFKKDITKRLTSTKDVGELSPGTVSRRVTPEGGIRRHNERIHRESKIADDHKNLPFTFSKPKKPKKSKLVKCDSCGHIMVGTINTVGAICENCHKFSSVSEVVYD